MLNNIEAIYGKVVFLFFRVAGEIDIIIRGRKVDLV